VVESLRSREGHHLFVYPFRGRLANEGLAMLMALRLSAATPTSITVTANDYGFELLCASDLPESVKDLRRLLDREALTADLLRGIDSTESARRRFRDIARIAGLVLPGFPGRSKSSAALQASSGLVYDVLRKYDPQNLLLDQARAEVLEAELDQRRIGAALERIAAMQLELYRPPRLTPFAFPLWAARLQTQMISSESWQTRIEKAAARLEREAGHTDRGAA
jgi:ATP-dependent Lhr-like helicase